MQLWGFPIIISLLLVPRSASSFTPSATLSKKQPYPKTAVSSQRNDESTYEKTDSSSKGIVSSLTNVVNFFFPSATNKDNQDSIDPLLEAAPSSVQELADRIRDDYAERNYLWTGDVDFACFNRDCRFTDPTISFEGRDVFKTNTANLKVLVDRLTQPGETESVLLSIDQTNPEFIETRWNMVGSLSGLPWKPKIDVIGKTKFWFREQQADSEEDEKSLQVYFYDERWEMPAGKALLQLITPQKSD